MRRIAGAWLLFSLLTIPRWIDMADRLLTNPPGRASARIDFGGPAIVGRSDYRQDIPEVNDLPFVKTAPVSDKLPSRFLQHPLEFFSTAPPESLVLLPGIGPVLAARICDARGGKRLFTTWDDLLQVRGIGQKTISKFRRLADER